MKPRTVRPRSGPVDIGHLEILVARESISGVTQAFRRMSEPERRQLAPDCRRLHQSFLAKGRYLKVAELPPHLREACARPPTHETRRLHAISGLAVYATAELKHLPKSYYDYYEDVIDGLIEILVDRRPKWLQEWVERKLSEDVRRQNFSWQLLRGLIRAGAVRSRGGEGYIRYFGSPWVGGDHDDPYDQLRTDPDLLRREVWQLFEVQTMAFDDESGRPWARALARLADDGLLSRDRLRTAARQTLTLGWRKSNTEQIPLLIELLG